LHILNFARLLSYYRRLVEVTRVNQSDNQAVILEGVLQVAHMFETFLLDVFLQTTYISILQLR